MTNTSLKPLASRHRTNNTKRPTATITTSSSTTPTRTTATTLTSSTFGLSINASTRRKQRPTPTRIPNESQALTTTTQSPRITKNYYTRKTAKTTSTFKINVAELDDIDSVEDTDQKIDSSSSQEDDRENSEILTGVNNLRSPLKETVDPIIRQKYTTIEEFTTRGVIKRRPTTIKQRATTTTQRPTTYYRQPTQRLTTTPKQLISTTRFIIKKHRPDVFEKISHSGTIKPLSEYDYYDDDNERIVADIPEHSKVLIDSSGGIHCLDQGNFPHPVSCKKFIYCAKMENGKVIGWEYTCPKNLSFDPVGGICNWAAGLGCKE